MKKNSPSTRSYTPVSPLSGARAIVEGYRGTAESKIKALTEAGVRVGDVPSDLGAWMMAMI